MAWLVLFVSAALETVWATALGASDGFTVPGPTALFAVTIVVSLAAFGYVLKHIPISTAYAVWTGTGAALTVLWGMATGAEPVTFLRLLFIAGIVGCVVGLKLVPAARSRPPGARGHHRSAAVTPRVGGRSARSGSEVPTSFARNGIPGRVRWVGTRVATDGRQVPAGTAPPVRRGVR